MFHIVEPLQVWHFLYLLFHFISHKPWQDPINYEGIIIPVFIENVYSQTNNWVKLLKLRGKFPLLSHIFACLYFNRTLHNICKVSIHSYCGLQPFRNRRGDIWDVDLGLELLEDNSVVLIEWRSAIKIWGTNGTTSIGEVAMTVDSWVENSEQWNEGNDEQLGWEKLSWRIKLL